jgi:hypothetical protein
MLLTEIVIVARVQPGTWGHHRPVIAAFFLCFKNLLSAVPLVQALFLEKLNKDHKGPLFKNFKKIVQPSLYFSISSKKRYIKI